MAFSHENTLLPTEHGENNIFDLWTRLRRLSVDIIQGTNQGLSFLQIEDAISQCQLNLESLTLSSTRLELRAPALPSASLRSVTFHTGIDIYTGRTRSFAKHLKLIQASPLIQHIDLKGFRIRNDELKALGGTCKGLTSLVLMSCNYACNGLRYVLDLCASLERLHAHGIEGVYGVSAVWWLFGGASWACRDKLQELVLNIVWTERDTRQSKEFSGRLLATMWDALNKLSRLRILKLKHVGRSDPFGIGIQWGIKLPRRLERLCLTGHRSWTREDVVWIAENLKQLDELEYVDKEMDKALRFWMQKSRRDMRLVETDAW
ncbi:hypothetical protein BGX34_007815 [Mortierella sp. NVP85]|nr:hypothetical protein BGX34_007815 [Mortierella sp. NVP85]